MKRNSKIRGISLYKSFFLQNYHAKNKNKNLLLRIFMKPDNFLFRLVCLSDNIAVQIFGISDFLMHLFFIQIRRLWSIFLISHDDSTESIVCHNG